ncbi:MAG: DNA repair protein RadA [Actinobacteria bacterium]|nr:MAG: DNA repair protein RadA [Actinomycetota bacterium]
MSKVATGFVCGQCGYISPQWLGRCPDCEQYNTFAEELTFYKGASDDKKDYSKPEKITEVNSVNFKRTKTGISELDRVLGGGIVPGSLVLLGGQPGIGKSTLLLQLASQVSNQGQKVLLVSGEESVNQVKMRAQRVGSLSDNTLVLSETNLEYIDKQVKAVNPQIIIIDSIQTMSLPEVSSAPGSVSQIRECTARLLKIAKDLNKPVFIVGHVTKEGAIAGPRLLEHIVDTVLYFEGDSCHSYRIIRAHKNRFGSTNEVGVFEMRDSGLVEVANPSQLFLSQRQSEPGSVVVATIEGTRPLLVEVQALVTPSYFSNPRRQVSGLDYNRLAIIIAVLEKRVGLSLANKDVYANVAGGLKVGEAGADIGIALAVASSLKNKKLSADTIAFGEIGLSGELRQVSSTEQRVIEASKLGFKNIIMPELKVKTSEKIKLCRVSKLEQAMEYLT